MIATEKDRLRAALRVSRFLFENSASAAEKFPSGSRLTPISLDGDDVVFTVMAPDCLEAIERESHSK